MKSKEEVKVAVALYSRGVGSVESIKEALARELPGVTFFGADAPLSLTETIRKSFNEFDVWIFVGAMGICVRTIAPLLKSKYSDPAVICVDTCGRFAVSVVSGHIGGANEWCRRVAGIVGAEPVITTRSDNAGLVALDTLDERFGWQHECRGVSMNEAISLYVNGAKVALLLDVRDAGTEFLERELLSSGGNENENDTHITYCSATAPREEISEQREQAKENPNENKKRQGEVKLVKGMEELPEGCELLIAVTYRELECSVPILYYRPKVLHVGMGCRKDCPTEGTLEAFVKELKGCGLSPLAIKSFSTITLKKDEPLIASFVSRWGADFNVFEPEELAHITVPNPSEKVKEVTGIGGVAEASAIFASGHGFFGSAQATPETAQATPEIIEKKSESNGAVEIERGEGERRGKEGKGKEGRGKEDEVGEGTKRAKGILIAEKRKVKVAEGCEFTFAVAVDVRAERKGFIEIVGAGPGDPELISLRGKYLIERADLILYAGSLVPVELTYYAKPGAVVRSSASMTLEEQFELMKSFYDRGLFIVRLHTGDPCIYGAIQEQMAFFDKYGMDYHITPGISSFLAAAAELRSQFTIPGKVQSIILTRGEGRTPMPEREKLHLLARSQSTMCIFLSASVVDDVERELLECYSPETPVAVCYHLTWRDEKIFRGELKNLAKIVKENELTLTTMIVVGEAIGNREGLSNLYSSHFSHLFRP